MSLENLIEDYIETCGQLETTKVVLSHKDKEWPFIVREMDELLFLKMMDMQNANAEELADIENVKRQMQNSKYISKMFKMILPECVVSPPISLDGKPGTLPYDVLKFAHKQKLIDAIFSISAQFQGDPTVENSFPTE